MGFELQEAAKNGTGGMGRAANFRKPRKELIRRHPRDVALWEVSWAPGTSAEARTKSTTRPIGARKRRKTETRKDRLRELEALEGGRTFSTPLKICLAPKCEAAFLARSVFEAKGCDLSQVSDVRHESCRRNVRTRGKVATYNYRLEGGKKMNAVKLDESRAVFVNCTLGSSQGLLACVGAMHYRSGVGLRGLQDAIEFAIFDHMSTRFREGIADSLLYFYAMEELATVGRRLTK